MAGSLAGRVLGKYRLIEKVGTGSMADVYRALQIGLDREVAIKVLPPALAADRVMVERFRRASQETARLSHPNVITIFDSGEAGGLPYYAMEYLRSGTLEDRQDSEPPLTATRALKVALDVLKALAYAHERGMVHGDLTAAHVKFDARENAIVTGWARNGAGANVASDLEAAAALVRAIVPAPERDEVLAAIKPCATARELLAAIRNVELARRARTISRAIDRIPIVAAGTPSEPSGPIQPDSDDSWDVLSSLSAILTHEEERRAVVRAFSWAAPLFLFGLVGVGWLVRVYYH